MRPNGPATEDLILSRPARISGKVTVRASGSPVANMIVGLQSSSGTGIATTAADGTYAIGGMYPGDYIACAGDNPTDNYLDQCYQDFDVAASGIASYTVVHVPDGGDVTGIDFHLDRGSTISGTLRDSTTQKVLGNRSARFLLYSTAGDIVANLSANTDANGVYSLPGIAPGNYYLMAEVPHVLSHPNSYYTPKIYGGSSCSATIQCDLSTGVGLTVPAGGGASDINLSLLPGHSISGVVADAETGYPLSGVTVSACEGLDATFDVTARTTTNFFGQYSLSHVVGVPELHASTSNQLGYDDLAWPQAPISSQTGCASLDGERLTFSDPYQALSDIDFALPKGAVIAGAVIASDLAVHYSGLTAQVAIWQDLGYTQLLVWQGSTDAYGSFLSPAMTPGTYYALAYLSDAHLCQTYLDAPCTADGQGFRPEFATPISITTHFVSDIVLRLPVDIFRANFE